MPLKLELSGHLWVHEPTDLDRFFTDTEVVITLATDDPDELADAGIVYSGGVNSAGEMVVHLGTAEVTRLHINLACNLGVDLFGICDSRDQFWYGLFEAFLTNDEDTDGAYQDKDGLDDCATGDLFLIHRIVLEPEYRGRGIEMAVTQQLVQNLGARCDLAVYYVGDQIEDLKWLKPMCFERLDTEPDLAFLNLLYKLPTVEQVKGQTLRFATRAPERQARKELPCN